MAFTKTNTGKARQATLLCLFLSGVCLMPLSPAFAQQDVDSRLSRLENEIQTLSRALFKGETPPSGISGGASASGMNQGALEVRLSQIESDMRNLTGSLEQKNHEQKLLEDNIADMQARIADLELRLSQAATTPPSAQTAPLYTGSQQATNTPATLTQPDAAVPSTTATVSATGGDPTSMYESAYGFLSDKKYPEAERGFIDFLDKYPEHNLAANAKYWLGETYYVRHDFEKSARVFAEAYQKYPNGPKGADSLLKLALSLNGLGKKPDACVALAQLKKEYPAGNSPVLERADREGKALGCL